MFSTTKGQFKFLGYLESLSFVVLLFFSIVVKRMWGHEHAIEIPGMIHGVLFIAYVAMAFKMKSEYNLSIKKLAWMLVASIIPLGPLYIDAKILKDLYKTN